MTPIRTPRAKFHPLTGAPLVPAGYRRNGSPIWPIMGGSGEAGDGGGDGDGSGGDGGEGGSGGDGDGSGSDDGAGDDKGGDSPWDDPSKAKAEIERLRRENGSDRTKAKEQAAADARKALTEDIAKALGLKEGEKAPTVDELTKKLTEQTGKTEQAAATARDTQAELIVWQNAKELGVDAGALTDSRAFAAAIKDLDPTDAKFAEAVKTAAQEAAEKNPKLKAAQGADSSGADHSGGSGGDGTKSKPKSLDDAVSGHYGG